jgi:hypothetical protein
MRRSLLFFAYNVALLTACSASPDDTLGAAGTAQPRPQTEEATLSRADALATTCKPPGVKHPGGSHHATGPYAHTIAVNAVPGDALASGKALRDAVAGITGASSTNKYLIRLSAGEFDITYQPDLGPYYALILKDHVDVEGTGPKTTTLVAHMDSYSQAGIWVASGELRALRLQATATGDNFIDGAIVVLPSSGPAALRDIEISLPSATSEAEGIWAAGSVTLDGVSIEGSVAANPQTGFPGWIDAVVLQGGTTMASDLSVNIDCGADGNCTGINVSPPSGSPTAASRLSLRDSSLTVLGYAALFAGDSDVKMESVALASTTVSGGLALRDHTSTARSLAIDCSSVTGASSSSWGTGYGLQLEADSPGVLSASVSNSVLSATGKNPAIATTSGHVSLRCAGDTDGSGRALNAACANL